MRKLRQLSIAVLLALMLGAPAFGGIVDCPPAPAPPPSSVMATGTTDTPPSDAQPVVATDPVVDIALNLLQGALSLFY
jgi:hypothetical protein